MSKVIEIIKNHFDIEDKGLVGLKISVPYEFKKNGLSPWMRSCMGIMIKHKCNLQYSITLSKEEESLLDNINKAGNKNLNNMDYYYESNEVNEAGILVDAAIRKGLDSFVEQLKEDGDLRRALCIGLCKSVDHPKRVADSLIKKIESLKAIFKELDASIDILGSETAALDASINSTREISSRYSNK